MHTSESLIQALNAAAASLQQAISSENEVYRVFREQVGSLGFRGGLAEVSEDRTRLVFRAIAFPRGIMGDTFTHLARRLGMEPSGFSVGLHDVQAFRRVVENGEPELIADSTQVLTEILPARARPFLRRLLAVLHRSPVILAPLSARGRPTGLLNVAGPGLWQQDVPAIRAFANHLAIALENSRLFSATYAAYEKLKASELRYRLVLERSNDAICVVQRDRIAFVNDKAAALMGSPAADLIGAVFSQRLTPRGRSVAVQALADTAGGRREQARVVVQVSAASGRDVQVELGVSRTLLDEEPACLVVMSDIGTRQRVEEELRKAQRLESLGLLAGGIAHDFNNLLTGIMANVSLVKMRSAEGGEEHAMLADAEKAVMQARRLTGQLLTFSRGGAPVKRLLSLAEVLADAVSLSLRGSSVNGVYDLPAGLWPVMADEGQMRQVVQNLAINAIQAMPGGGAVTVAARNVTVGNDETGMLPAGEYVRVEVRDEGCGIPDAIRQRIFDPFFSTKSEGTGLGLSVVYSIIQRHGGHIGVTENTPAGSTFYFYLPAVQGTPAPADDPPGGLPALEGRVLVMEDEPLVARVLERLLGCVGLRSSVVAEGRAAVAEFSAARAAGDPYDAVIMDLTVPGGLGGREAVRDILAIDPDARVVVSTGYSSDPIMADYRRYGFMGAVMKPYSPEELYAVLGPLVRSRRPG